MDEESAPGHRRNPGGVDPDDPDFDTSFLDVCEELAHAWGKYPEEIMRLPYCKLKRWIEVYLRRKRREWKTQWAFHALGLQAQSAAMLGAGGEPEAGGMGAEMSDAERSAALVAAGVHVEVRKGA